MKLKSLYIKKYKNLSGTYNFEKSNAYIALIGLNGSGKSNLLEVISIIFKIISGLCPKNSIGDFSFTESAYVSVITPVINSRKYKDFRNNSIGNKGTAIKDYIEKNYNTFPDTAFYGFKTVLDELMNVFNF